MNEVTLDQEPAFEESRAEGSAELVRIPRVELEALRKVLEKEATWKERAEHDSARISELERRVDEWRDSYRAAVRDRELATALAGRPLLPGAAAQLLRLWREDFEVIEEDGRSRVVDREGLPVERAVTEWLASPEFAHFRSPSTRGGTTPLSEARNTSPTPPVPRTLGESLLQKWREDARGAPDNVAPIGLGRRR